jgi:hypothetical protein
MSTSHPFKPLEKGFEFQSLELNWKNHYKILKKFCCCDRKETPLSLKRLLTVISPQENTQDPMVLFPFQYLFFFNNSTYMSTCDIIEVPLTEDFVDEKWQDFDTLERTLSPSYDLLVTRHDPREAFHLNELRMNIIKKILRIKQADIFFFSHMISFEHLSNYKKYEDSFKRNEMSFPLETTRYRFVLNTSYGRVHYFKFKTYSGLFEEI